MGPIWNPLGFRFRSRFRQRAWFRKLTAILAGSEIFRKGFLLGGATGVEPSNAVEIVASIIGVAPRTSATASASLSPPPETAAVSTCVRAACPCMLVR